MINKKILFSVFTTFALCSLSYSGYSQENISTKSGQLLTVAVDGSYMNVANEANVTTTDEFMGAEINPLELPNQVNSDDNLQERLILRDLKSQLKEIEAKSTVDRHKSKIKIQSLKEKLKKAKRTKLESAITELEKEIKYSQSVYDTANNRADESYELIKRVDKLSNAKESKKTDKINALVLESSTKLGTTTQGIQSTIVNYTFETDDRNPELISHNPACNITFNGKDESLGKKRVEHAPQHLFGYTNEKLKHFLKNDNFLNCDAYLTKLDGDYFLNLDLDLATKSASKNYGFINKGDMIKLSFINGSNFIAYSIYRAEGKLEPYSGHTKYEAVYKLQDIEMELIEDYELDKIAIIWSSGFEEYPIYEIDLLQHQLQCIKKAE